MKPCAPSWQSFILHNHRNPLTGLTYVYQGHSDTGSLRLAPVSPEQGIKWMSFLGLKPTFFRNGTSFSLHSSYLQERYEKMRWFIKTVTCITSQKSRGNHKHTSVVNIWIKQKASKTANNSLIDISLPSIYHIFKIHYFNINAALKLTWTYLFSPALCLPI